MATYRKITPPNGQVITANTDGSLSVPDQPIVPVIEGDGIGPDVCGAMRRIVDAAVEKCYGGKRRIVWFDVYAGEAAHEMYGEWLPEDTLNADRKSVV